MNATSPYVRIATPVAFGIAGLVLWEVLTRALAISPHILPGPLAIAAALIADHQLLLSSLLVTMLVTGIAFVSAVVVGGLVAIAFSLSRWVELALFPYAVILQVTPIVAIAPLLIVWVNNVWFALLVCAWLVAFFPVLSNASVGLKSADRNLEELFRLYGASRSQTLVLLRIPAALPYFLAGVRISGGLALIGAVVAEFVAGSGGQGSGLAYRILEAGYQLKTPRMFAALFLIGLAGVAIFLCTSYLSRRLLAHWHESALESNA